MAQLAIKGHKTRGSEVIALLKMLGGNFTYYSHIPKDIFPEVTFENSPQKVEFKLVEE